MNLGLRVTALLAARKRLDGVHRAVNTRIMLDYPFTYPKFTGRLVERLNRFVVRVEVEGRLEEAYLANPGRLWELLLPGTELLLTPARPGNKLPYTVLACRKDNIDVLLHTHLTNKIVRSLVEQGRLEQYKGFRVVRGEPAWGRHRFDLLLKGEKSGRLLYLEIKTCTLFAGCLAMFPDAVSSRGTAHLRALGNLSGDGVRAECLFVIMSPGVKYFLPAYHIDPDFTRAFVEAGALVRLEAVALGFDRPFTTVETIKTVTIPSGLLETEFANRGLYLLLIASEDEKVVAVGRLGRVSFAGGYYIYTGSAMGNLSQRIARHFKRNKPRRWHIDYLTAEQVKLTAVPIVTADRLECSLAADLKALADGVVPGFGSGDCRCESHLFFFAANPLANPRFIDLIQHYRIGRLAEKMSRGRRC